MKALQNVTVYRPVYFRRHPTGGRAKLCFDVAVAAGAILFLLPMLAALWACLLVAQGRPVTIGHRRIGFAGREFMCLKFRTMVKNSDEALVAHLESCPHAAAEWRERRKLKEDPRVTKLGRILRVTSLDELPQLFNIAAGEMSIVGPRPITADEIAYYGSAFHLYAQARPGLTGMWQISGRDRVGYNDRVKLDSNYIRNWSFAKDISIIAKTLPALIFTSRGE